jgi:PIN domain nuclease of toxin-antitoxin system
VRLLIDSHVALWWLDDSASLGRRCREAIESADEVKYSAVTPWELGIMQALGRLSMPEEVGVALEASGFEQLSISVRHAALAPTLPAHHRDPFDRMLIAQATLESLTLVTADGALKSYEVPLLDARH